LSTSEYDLALANIMANAGWSPTEIASVLRAHRRKWGDTTTKLDRADYYATTIAKAMTSKSGYSIEREQVKAEVERVESQDRGEKIAGLATLLRIPLTNVQMVSGAVPKILLTLDKGGEERVIEVAMEAIVDQGTLKRKMYALSGVPMRTVGRQEQPGWDWYLTKIAEAAEVVHGGRDATLLGELRALVGAFLGSRGLTDQDSGQVVDHPTEPFRRDGKVWFRLDELSRHAIGSGIRIERMQLAQRLRSFGAERKTMRCLAGRAGRETTWSFYGLPNEWADGEREEGTKE
jgi:hypothetical protein